jgi:magnesium transporter
MPRAIKKRSKKAGLAPGTLLHLGERKVEEIRIRVMDYDEKHLKEVELKMIEEASPFKETPTVTWINVDGLHQVGVLEKIGQCFGLHPLVLEDILNTDHRPKMEDLGDYIYIVLKMIHYHDKSNEIETEQVSLILGQSFVISFQEREGDIFNPVRERIRTSRGQIRRGGPDYLAYALMDTLVDNYFIVLEKLGERIEVLEEKLVANPTRHVLHLIHDLKRSMIFLRKSVWPLRELVNGLERGESPLIRPSTKMYLRDVYDHTIHIIDTVETYRDLMSGMLDIYLSSVSNRLNEVMKVLTIIATIFIPLTFIVGVYGMNFKNMPELEWRWGYLAVWSLMIVIGFSMAAFFKKRKWF